MDNPMENISKKQAIMNTALTLFVNQGFYATSTASIASQAGVATGTLFHHFPSKEALMTKLFLDTKHEFADHLKQHLSKDDSLQTNARNIWFAAIDWGINNPNKESFFQQYSMSPTISVEIREEAMNSILGFISKMLRLGKQQGLLADYPEALMLEICHGQYLAASRFFIDHPELWQDEQHREASFSMFWKALAI